VNDFERLSSALADRYRIQREIGAGGMATVYLAHDVKHDRNVAVKVLQPELAAVLGAERFLNEIRVTANLQHPHILPLHDSGTAGPPDSPNAFLYYVMPYVEGESLRDRLNRETQLSIEDALQIAQEVADGLSYAHSLGVVHRDIKPENILLTGGHALIADFGIARAVTEAGGTRLTETGLSLGTPQYMSPEQASGEREVDARSDVYALGCVTYEMLVGEPPHTGPNAQAIIAKVLTQQVTSVRESRDLVSPQADSAIRKALAKLPADRFGTVQQFADALRTSGPTTWDTASGAVAVGQKKSRRPWVSFLPWGLVATLTAVIVGLLAWPSGSAPRSTEGATRLVLDLGEADSVSTGIFPTQTGAEVRTVAISQDGRRIAFIGRSAGEATTHLYIRELDGFVARRLPETASASSPFFSPDGEWVGFYSWSEGRLKTVPVTGGTPQVVCVCPPLHSATWGPDGSIIMDHAALGGLRAVEARGGEPEEFTFREHHYEDDEYNLVHPQLLPGGSHLLATAWGSGASARRIVLFSLESSERTTLLENGWAPQYVQSGHLVFQRRNQLWAARFDIDRLEVVGTPEPVVDSVYSAPFTMMYAVSESGTLVYAPGPFPDPLMSTQFMSRSGQMESILPEAGRWDFAGPRLSPAGDRIVSWGSELAGWREGQSSARIWLFDFAGRSVQPLTDPGPGDYWPIWAPDGRTVVYGSVRSGERQELYRVAVDEPGALPELVYSDSAAGMQPYSWLPGGDGLAFNRALTPGADIDIWLVRFGADTTAGPLVAGPANEFHPAISPDGRWLAYTSDQSGQPEVYLMRYPELDDVRQVSSGGGIAPLWRADGRELYYAAEVEVTGATFMRVPVVDGPGDPVEAWSTSVPSGVGVPYGSGYDVTPDGQRLVLSVNERGWLEFLPELRIVFNWFDELEGAFEP
jgi:serine/threonine-protein kinase